MEQNRIYLDNAAATKTDPEVVQAMLPYFTETYAVASSQFSHSPGILAKEGLDNAREIIAKKINASPDEIIFTSGGTEASNLAVKGTAWAHRGEKDHIVCSKIENNAVLHSCQWLENEGFNVTYLDVDEDGFVDLDQLQDAISDKTFLVSVQHGNQEVGTVQPIDLIGKICREKGVLYHVDATWSFTLLDLNMEKLGVDLMTMSSNKIHGPKGVGALYIRKGTKIKKMIHGGYNEFDFRSGTENVSGVVGFGKAVELVQPSHIQHIRSLQKDLIEGLENKISGLVVNGPRDLTKRLPNNMNVSFHSVEGESVVLHLDMKGISVITGSACFSRSLEPSYVMMAMGFSHERAHGSIRYALSRFNQKEEIGRIVNSCSEVVEALLRISPLNKKE